MNRRDFLATVPLAFAAKAFPFSEIFTNDAPAPSDFAQTAAAPKPGAAHELDFATALQAAEAIRRKRVSSVELTRRVFERVDRL